MRKIHEGDLRDVTGGTIGRGREPKREVEKEKDLMKKKDAR